jgi:hypothetical protein
MSKCWWIVLAFAGGYAAIGRGQTVASGSAFEGIATSPTVQRDGSDAVKYATIDGLFRTEVVSSDGVCNPGGHRLVYRAMAGTLVVHPKGWDDARAGEHGGSDMHATGDSADSPAEASMFYVAYFASTTRASERPITFIYNGGPGSSTIWLHMGALGPRRVITVDATHSPAAPYATVDNAQTLLDASDLVFIDAPGTGFSRIAGKDKEKAFYGVDADAYALVNSSPYSSLTMDVGTRRNTSSARVTELRA